MIDPNELGRVLNSAEYRPYRDKAAELLEGIYGPLRWPWQRWNIDSRTEAVGLLLYTGAIGGEDNADPRIAAIEAKWPGLLDRLTG